MRVVASRLSSGSRRADAARLDGRGLVYFAGFDDLALCRAVKAALIGGASIHRLCEAVHKRTHLCHKLFLYESMQR